MRLLARVHRACDPVRWSCRTAEWSVSGTWTNPVQRDLLTRWYVLVSQRCARQSAFWSARSTWGRQYTCLHGAAGGCGIALQRSSAHEAKVLQ